MEEIQLVDRVLALLRQEWQAGASGSPGFHHQQQAMSRAQVAEALDIEFAPDTGPTAIRDERGQIVAVTRLVAA